jgi:DNA-binding MarR family transcriptional regulator
MHSDEISKSEYEALAEFRYTLRQFLRFSEEAAQEVGLTPQQHQALLAIEGYPGRSQVTVGELAERLQIRHHSAVGLIDRLASQELVVRQPSASDHRQVYVVVTPHGAQLLQKLATAHREELRRIGPQFRIILERLAVLGGG